MLAAKTGRKKIDRLKRMLLEEGLKEMEGKDSLYIDGDRCYGRSLFHASGTK
jgi:hypothetical protein